MKKEVNEQDKITQIEAENERLKKLLEESKRADDSWDFKWDGRGSYEESRRCFYGDFS